MLRRVLVLPLLAAALAGCGGLPGAPAPAPPEPGPVRKTPPAAPDGPGTRDSPPAPPPDAPAPGGSAPPAEAPPAPYCEGGPLDCRIYRSIGGRDFSGELGWLSEQPLEVSNVFANGTWTIGVMTPCNDLGVEVEVRAGQLVPGRIIGTAKACPGAEAGYEEWVRELFSRAVRWERGGGSLAFSNDHGTVEFQDAGPNAL